MKQSSSSVDEWWLVRYLHLHYFTFLFKLAQTKSSQPINFPKPRFQMFEPITRFDEYVKPQDKNKLFKNILLSFKSSFIVGMVVSIIYASFNLMLPQIIKEFMEIMQSPKSEIILASSYITEKFIILQILRMIFGNHMKRLFVELAIKIESTLSRKLIKKALMMDDNCRKRIPESEIYQLENVDLKLVNLLFSNFYNAFEIPFTIIVALVLLFIQDIKYGFIGLYWFLIIFFVQRALDDKMTHCNLTKLSLIDKRSKVNYEIMQKMELAKIAKCQGVIIEKNNDFFIHENHDHMQFYRYSTLYDISQLLLPIAVVVSIALYDYNEEKPFSVQQVYVMLSLLGICYNPMKQCRTFSINLNDGLHSLKRLSDYLDLPVAEDLPSTRYRNFMESKPYLAVEKGTVGKISSENINFQIRIKFHIEVKGGDCLIVLGRKGQGSSTFLNTLVGQNKITEGLISINGKIAYSPEQNFFIYDTIHKNLAFYNKDIKLDEIEEIYKALGLDEELRLTKGLNQIFQEGKFNENQLKLLSLARVFCSKSDVYILDSPYSGLASNAIVAVQRIIRRRQSQGKLIIMAMKKLQLTKPEDKIIIMNMAKTQEYGVYSEMVKNPRSYIDNFLKAKQQNEKDEEEEFHHIAKQFQAKVKRALMFSSLFQKEKEKKDNVVKINNLVKAVGNYSFQLKMQKEAQVVEREKYQHQQNFKVYLQKFLKSPPFSQSLYIVIIIIVAEFLHIFIHFYIGHQYEHHMKEGLSSLRALMLYEVILTLGLAGIMFLEGEVSSHLAVMTGSSLYKESLEALVKKDMNWYGKNYYLRTADKFNHDYEQIFITYHGVLNIYKNIVILVATILFIGGSQILVVLITALIALVYFGIFTIIRKAQARIVDNYYDYKYEFVKVFHQSIDGANIIKIYNVGNEVMSKGRDKYTALAGYKLSATYVTFGQGLICDLISTFVTAIAFQFGTGMRIDKHSNTAVIATSIMLLLGLSDVLKTIVDQSVSLQSFFRVNHLPFLQIVSVKDKIVSEDQIEHMEQSILGSRLKGYSISIRNVLLQKEDDNIFQNYPLSLQIKEGEKVVLCQNDETLRQNLLLGLTNNLLQLQKNKTEERAIFIGGKRVTEISSQRMRELVGVIMDQNFVMSGTLRQNLQWRVKNFNENEAIALADKLGFSDDLSTYSKKKLQAHVQAPDQQYNIDLGKKIAMLQILVRKPKIVIIKDTPSFLGKWSIVELLEEHNPKCTIIKISNSLQVAFDMNRVVYMQNLKIKEDGDPKKLKQDKLSKIGQLLRQSNIQAYLYRNRVSVTPKNFKQKNQNALISLLKSGMSLVK